MNKKNKIPSPGSYPIVGHLLGYARDPANYFLAMSKAHGDIMMLRILHKKIILVNHPDYVKEILINRVNDFQKSISYRHLKLLLGNGLLTSEGREWKRSRSVVQPAFYKETLPKVQQKILKCIEGQLGTWEDLCSSGTPVLNMSEEMLNFSMEVSCSALFGIEIKEHLKKVKSGLLVTMRYVYNKMEALYNLPSWVPTPASLQFRYQLDQLNKIVYDMIASKEGRNEQEGDVLRLLIRSFHLNQNGYNRQALRDDLITLFLSGFETTATTLMWVLYLMSCYREEQEKLYTEVLKIRDEDLANPLFYQKVPYLKAFVDEALRLYPPVWSFSREPRSQTYLNGYRLEKGNMIVICPYSLHRHPDFWEAPEAFNPDRFMGRKVPKTLFIPFGAGQRHCIGSHFAYFEMMLFLVKACRKFEFIYEAGQDLSFRPGITLRTQKGLKVGIKKRVLVNR